MERSPIVYLDYNATSPIDERVLEEMISVYRSHPGNADSRTHQYGNDAKKIVADARKAICNVLKITDTELVFTSGSTESNNMAVLGMLNYAQKTGKTHFITTSIEHKSVLNAMKRLESQGCTVDYISPDASGRVSVDDVLAAVTEQTALVSIMHVNSETGIIQPVHEIGKALEGKGVFFHVDATQSFGKLNGEIRKLRYDMLSFSAHKFGGPQGVGGLVLRRNKRYQLPPIQALFEGGQQERGIRPGTTPVALVAGMGLAATLSDNECDANMLRCAEIKAQFMKAIEGLRYTVNGNSEWCMPNTINISFEDVDAEGVFVALKEEYAFSNGSACNSGSYKPSYVLLSMGVDETQIYNSIRLSWSGETDVDFSALVDFISQMQ